MLLDRVPLLDQLPGDGSQRPRTQWWRVMILSPNTTKMFVPGRIWGAHQPDGAGQNQAARLPKFFRRLRALHRCQADQSGRYRLQASGHHFRQPRCRCPSGATPTTIEEMARDAVIFIHALGFDQVDLFGVSMGGMIAQVIAQQHPQLVRKMIIAGTGPAGAKASTR